MRDITARDLQIESMTATIVSLTATIHTMQSRMDSMQSLIDSLTEQNRRLSVYQRFILQSNSPVAHPVAQPREINLSASLSIFLWTPPFGKS